MSTLSLLKPSLFSAAQTTWLIVIAVIVVILIAGNAYLWYRFHKAGERKLCTRQLQQRREELLRHLAELKTGTPVAAVSAQESNQEIAKNFVEEEEAEDFAEEEDEEPEQSIEDSTENTANEDGEDGEDGDEELTTEVLPVTAMSAEMRSRFGLTGAEHENKQFVVRYSYSFEARLRNADADVQARYVEFADEVGLYKGVKIKNSYKQQRIYKGKKTLGLILFRGKTLCVAFALNPSDYMETKYRGQDKSKKMRFEKTPMLYKISSARRLEYAKYLLLQVADKNTIVMDDDPKKGKYNLQPVGRDDMYASGLMRINIVRELQDEAEAEAAATQAEATVAQDSAVEVPPAEPVTEAPVEATPAVPAETPAAPVTEAPAEAKEEE